MRKLFLLLCLLYCCNATAQKNIRYAGSVEGGLLKGSRPANGFVFTTQGVAYGQYTFGIGTGIDFYPFRSVPLFVDVKRKFTHKATQPFIQAGAGINFTSSHSSDAKLFVRYAGDGHFDNGFFARGGGGIIFRAQKKLKISLSAGYSYKTAVYSYKPFVGGPWMWQVQPVKDMFRFNRWYVGAGVMW